MKQKKYLPIVKARREYFGGIIFRERPAFVAYINREYADAYNIPERQDAIICEDIFSAPLDAHFAITTRCNMFCKGCYSIRKEDELKDIAIDKAKAVIDRLSDLGVFSLSFGGGEPTLHPGLIEIAAYARKKQILPNMTTNGLTMTEHFAEKCSVFGNVHFSIHKLQDMNHVFPASRVYHKITKNKSGLNLLLTTETLPHLDEILYNAGKSGIKKVLFLRYKKTIKNMDIQGLDIEKELEKIPILFKKMIRKYKLLMFLFDCSLFELLVENDFSDMYTYYKYDNNGCLGGNSYIAVDINGMYKPCSFWHEPFGSVFDLSFDSWINNPKLNKFRNMRRGESCPHCKYIRLCNGGCRLLYDKVKYISPL